MTLEEAIAKIKPLDHNAMEIGRASCRERV